MTNPSAVHRISSTLLRRDVIDRDGRSFVISDRFLRIWIRERDDWARRLLHGTVADISGRNRFHAWPVREMAKSDILSGATASSPIKTTRQIEPNGRFSHSYAVDSKFVARNNSGGGAGNQAICRVLICGHAGRKRGQLFPRESGSQSERLQTYFGSKSEGAA